MAALTPNELRRAAEILENEARILRGSYGSPNGWPDACTCGFGAKAEHDEMRSLAKKLRAEAGRRR